MSARGLGVRLRLQPVRSVTWSRFPCVFCGAPFGEVEAREEHQQTTGHTNALVQAEAVSRAKVSLTGDPDESWLDGSYPRPTPDDLRASHSAYLEAADDLARERAIMRNTNSRRRSLRLIRGGKT